MKTAKTYNFTFNIIDVQFLDWDADADIVTEKMKWEPVPEVAFDHITHADYSYAWLDVAIYLGENQNEYAAMIKVRTVFSITKFEQEHVPNEALAWLMDYAIGHCRSICACKCREQEITLPVIPYYTFIRLTEIASLSVFKPSVISLSHRSTYSEKNISALIGSRVIGIDRLRTIILLFKPLPADHPEVIISGIPENKASINFNYDHERLTDDEWKLHVDFGLKRIPFAEIKVRNVYALECTEEDLFTDEVLIPMIEDTFNSCMAAFKEQSALHKMTPEGEIAGTEDFFRGFSENTIRQYYDWRKKDNSSNKELLKPGLSLTVGGNTRLVVKGTFMIMDEIMFLNPAFDHKHNRNALQEGTIFESLYHTVKYNCLEIEKGPIQLSWIHTVVFYMCLDVAMQVLLSDRGEALQPTLIKNNFTEFRQKEFIKFAADQFKGLHQSLKDSGATITNFEKHYDWPALLK